MKTEGSLARGSRLVCGLALAFVLASCKGSSTSPSGTTQPGGGVPVVLSLQGPGPFTVTVQNQTFTTSGLVTANNVQNGTVTVSGQFVTTLSISLGVPNAADGHYAAAVQHGLVSTQGPVAGGNTDCQILYRDPTTSGTGGGTFTFSFQFTVVPSESFTSTSPPCAAPSS